MGLLGSACADRIHGLLVVAEQLLKLSDGMVMTGLKRSMLHQIIQRWQFH